MSQFDLHIVIPVLNGWAQTRRCLDALRKSTVSNFHIIVVDHGSTDQTPSALATEFPEVECIVGDESLWWAGATNLGIRHALAGGASRIMLLNNDCFLAPDAIVKLLKYCIVYADNIIISPLAKDIVTNEILNLGFITCLWLGFPSVRMPRFFWQQQKTPHKPLLVPIIMGGRGVIIPKHVFNTIGLLDDQALPHYLADHDFYLRAKQAGFLMGLAADASILVDNTHTTTASNLSRMTVAIFIKSLSSQNSHRNLKDLSTFFKKHYPIKQLYFIGVMLNFSRYFLGFAGARLTRLIYFYKRNF